jgi:tRNA A-37 threonylcarbamoyl transferase component Bud32
MDRGPYRKILQGNGWRWRVPFEDVDRLRPLLSRIETPEEIPEFRWVRSSTVRWVGAVHLKDDVHVFVKFYKPVGWLRLLWMNLHVSQWRREWRMMHLLPALGIGAPRPMALGEKRIGGAARCGALVTEAVPDAVSLGRILSDGGIAPATRENVIAALGRFISLVHERGILHRDLHADNILVVPGYPSGFYLLDLHRAGSYKGVTRRQRVWNLAQLFLSFTETTTDAEQDRILAHYLQGWGEAPPIRRVAAEIAACRRSLRRRLERSRTERCLRPGSRFAVYRCRGLRIVARRSFPVRVFAYLLEQNRSINGPADPRVMKWSAKSRLTRQSTSCGLWPGDLCVKTFPFRGYGQAICRAWRPSKAKRSWLGWWGLQVRGVDVPDAFLMWEEKRLGVTVSGGMVMEAIEDGAGLDRYVAAHFSPPPSKTALRRKRRFIERTAALLAHLHGKGVYHRDLKAGNLLVRQNHGNRIVVLDHDSVHFTKRLARGRRIHNLAQLNTSIPPVISRRDRLRFLLRYAGGQWSKEELRAVVTDVSRRSAAIREGKA